MVNKQSDRSRDRAREDYLKAIYHLGQGGPVKAVRLAQHLSVSRASVSKSRRVLEREGLVVPNSHRGGALQLTPHGTVLALRVIRRHRLVETFLHRSLGVPLARIHEDAERIEHSISDDIARRLAQFLGNPASDPHGHRIAAQAAIARPTPEKSPADMPAGSRIVITTVDDQNAKIMRKLVALGLLPGRRALLLGNAGRGIRLRAGANIVHVPREVADSIRCVRIADAKTA